MSRPRRKTPSTKTFLSGWKPVIPSGTQTVGVQSVSQEDAQTLQWTFTSAVTSVAMAEQGTSEQGGATVTVPQLLASGNGSAFLSPTAVTLLNGGLQAVYAGPVLSPGSVYSVTSTPTGVTFATGPAATLSVPQTGTVISAAEAAERAEAARAKAPSPRSLKLTAAGARRTKSTARSKGPARRAA